MNMLSAVLLALFAAQDVILQELQREELIKRSAMGQHHTVLAAVVFAAQYDDGSPAQGWVGCEGSWHKHQDGPKKEGGQYYMFLTDSRGHMILNPSLLDLETEDPWSCTARDRVGRTGQAFFHFIDRGLHVITIKR